MEGFKLGSFEFADQFWIALGGMDESSALGIRARELRCKLARGAQLTDEVLTADAAAPAVGSRTRWEV
jgi:hypothetical protein